MQYNILRLADIQSRSCMKPQSSHNVTLRFDPMADALCLLPHQSLDWALQCALSTPALIQVFR